MTIHHDKLVYGKIASGVEELSEDKIAEMLKELSEEKAEEGKQTERGGEENSGRKNLIKEKNK